MKIYLDTEFNGFGGELISIGMVGINMHGTTKEFYQVTHCNNPTPWVYENVIPNLGKLPIDRECMQALMQMWLAQFGDCVVVADWPEDIKHFCDLMIVGPRQCMSTPRITFELRRDAMPVSSLSHNALADARALRDWDVARMGEEVIYV